MFDVGSGNSVLIVQQKNTGQTTGTAHASYAKLVCCQCHLLTCVDSASVFGCHLPDS